MKELLEWREYPATREMYDNMRDDIMASAQVAGISETREIQLELGVEEMLINIIDYAYDDPGAVWIRTRREGELFRLDFADYGRPFNPLAEDMRHSEGLPVEEREEGGLGIHLVRKSFDRIEYAYEDFQGKKANILSLWLKLV
ncbi:ATP-binding protein [Selenomonas sp. KH1T6]|uniref:ATP-binding protein n=1 Tax=Selenomonas sp. KH1T6 TaxID=3158784 RepID=UPI0008A73E3C|nr:Anti-sigma regulatory factor (Ser/Thr protein kinase) [Selenomonas ruminantium]